MTPSNSKPATPPAVLTLLMRSRPRDVPATSLLVLTILGVYAVLIAQGAQLHPGRDAMQIAWGANFGPATADGQWWRLASAIFVHFSAVHVAVNAWALWDCGRLVERLLGSARFLGVFLGSGIGASLVSLAVHGNDALSAGASGAVFGLYGALLARLWRQRSSIPQSEFRWFFGGAALFATAAIALGLLVPGIDNAAHAGGLGAGAGLSLVLDAGGGRWIRLGAALALGSGATLAYFAVPDPAYRWRDELRARAELNEFAMEERQLSARWRTLVARRAGATFEELADRIEAEVAQPYQETFEQLSAFRLSPEAPTARPLDSARRYARLRSEASQLLVEGLRAHDEGQIREALERIREAPYAAEGGDPRSP